jgi:hypothetical protein
MERWCHAVLWEAILDLSLMQPGAWTVAVY